METSRTKHRTLAQCGHVSTHISNAVSRHSQAWRVAIIAAALACTLSACGGSSSPSPSPDSKAIASPVAPVPVVAVPASNASGTSAASTPVAASSPEPASAPAAALASTPVVTVAVYGDDQMMGDAFNSMDIVSIVSPDEPDTLQTLLQAQFNDTGVTVQSDAMGGTASSLQNELDGMDGGGQAQPARMSQSGAQIAIEEHTINDDLGGETLSEYTAYLGQWIQDAQASGIQPVLEEASPVCDGNHPQLASYVAAMDAVAKQYGVPVIAQYAYVQSIPNWQTHMINCEIPDSYLDALKAKQEQAVIGPIVKVLIGRQS